MRSHFTRVFRIGIFTISSAAVLLPASVLRAEVRQTESTSANVQTIVQYPASVTPEDRLSITFRNLNAFDVLMMQTEGLFFDWRIEVRDAPSGSIIAPSDAGRALLGAEIPGMTELIWLKPGESTSWYWNIDSLYSLSPGRYRISIVRRFWTRENQPIDVVVPEFEIEVKA